MTSRTANVLAAADETYFFGMKVEWSYRRLPIFPWRICSWWSINSSLWPFSKPVACSHLVPRDTQGIKNIRCSRLIFLVSIPKPRSARPYQCMSTAQRRPTSKFSEVSRACQQTTSDVPKKYQKGVHQRTTQAQRPYPQHPKKPPNPTPTRSSNAGSPSRHVNPPALPFLFCVAKNATTTHPPTNASMACTTGRTSSVLSVY